MIERRIDDLMGIDPHFGEAIQGQRYAVGQEYRGHCDWFPPSPPISAKRSHAAGSVAGPR
jgi:prolyl 4-hydroxylase